MLRSAIYCVLKPERVLLQAKQTLAVFGVNNATKTTSRSSTVNEEMPVPEFSDHRLMFSRHSTRELLRTFLVLRTCAVGTLVDNSYALLRQGERLLGERVLCALVAPFYRQFVAGDSEESLVNVTRRLHGRRVRIMLAPMLESDVGDGQSGGIFAANFRKMGWFLCITAAHGGPSKDTLSHTSAPAVCAAKVTGHCSADVMEKVSSQYSAMDLDCRLAAVLWTAGVMATEGDDGTTTHAHDTARVHTTTDDTTRRPDQDLVAKRCASSLEKNVKFMKSSSLEQLEMSCPFDLHKDDRKHLIDGLRRISFIGSLAEQLDVVLVMDAEYTYVNPAINLVTLALMSRHNGSKPIIWNTYQAYLKQTDAWMLADRSLSDRLGCCFGIKLVRGAYMDHERRWARSRGLPDPVQNTYADTNAHYDRLASRGIVLAKNSPDRFHFMLATHNEASIRAALQTLAKLGTGYLPNCVFAQIYGMAEYISLPLATSGAVVYKSVPVGSVTEVLPYLARRASENKAVMKGGRKERELLIKEIRDRAMRGGRKIKESE